MARYRVNNFGGMVLAKEKIREKVEVPIPKTLDPLKGVLAVDPGMTTGLAWRMPNGDYMTTTSTDTTGVWEMIDPNILSLVIYENYAGKLISKYGLETVRIVGGIQALCMLYQIPMLRHVPQTRRAFIRFARDHIKRTKGETFVVHEVDALSHIFAYEHVYEGKKKWT